MAGWLAGESQHRHSVSLFDTSPRKQQLPQCAYSSSWQIQSELAAPLESGAQQPIRWQLAHELVVIQSDAVGAYRNTFSAAANLAPADTAAPVSCQLDPEQGLTRKTWIIFVLNVPRGIARCDARVCARDT